MEDFFDTGCGLCAIEGLPSNGCCLKQWQHAFLVVVLGRGEGSFVGEKTLLFKVPRDTRVDRSDKVFDIILRDVSGIVKAGVHLFEYGVDHVPALIIHQEEFVETKVLLHGAKFRMVVFVHIAIGAQLWYAQPTVGLAGACIVVSQEACLVQ